VTEVFSTFLMSFNINERVLVACKECLVKEGKGASVPPIRAFKSLKFGQTPLHCGTIKLISQ